LCLIAYRLTGATCIYDYWVTSSEEEIKNNICIKYNLNINNILIIHFLTFFFNYISDPDSAEESESSLISFLLFLPFLEDRTYAGFSSSGESESSTNFFKFRFLDMGFLSELSLGFVFAFYALSFGLSSTSKLKSIRSMKLSFFS